MKVLVGVFALLVGALGAPNPDSRIIGGWNALRGQFPSIVSLDYCVLSICQHSCGGTIIAPSWVLSAGHCSTEVPLPSLGNYYAVAGILDLDDSNSERQRVRVSDTIVHPDYIGGVNPHDIALFRLASSLLYNTYVQPSVLPQPGQEFTGEVVLAGWGSVGGVIIPQLPNRLQTVDLPLLPVHDCHDALTSILQGSEHPLDLDSNICTGAPTSGISACSGDSGGPLLKDNILIGIVSWGVTPCGTVGAPTVYNKVSHNTFWIREVTGIEW